MKIKNSTHKRNIKLHENGYELVIADKIIGHRGFRVLYNQSARSQKVRDVVAFVCRVKSQLISQEEHRQEMIKKQKEQNIQPKYIRKQTKESYKRDFPSNEQRYFRPDNPI